MESVDSLNKERKKPEIHSTEGSSWVESHVAY